MLLLLIIRKFSVVKCYISNNNELYVIEQIECRCKFIKLIKYNKIFNYLRCV